MIVNSASAYNSLVSSLQALGFSGFPAASLIDFTATTPVKINVTCVHAQPQPSTMTGDNVVPYTP